GCRPDRGARPRRRRAHRRLPGERARPRGERSVLPLLREHGGAGLAAAPGEGALQGGRQLDARRARAPRAGDGPRGPREPGACEGRLSVRRLDGKAAVVTGAGRGIGRAIAELLAAEGAAVVVNDLGAEVDGRGSQASVADEVVAAIGAKGGRAVASYENVADFQAAERIVGTAVREFGAIDVLVNNAGILRDRMLFNMTEEEWDAVIAVHLKGTFNCTRHAAVHMRQQRRGRIISISSTS